MWWIPATGSRTTCHECPRTRGRHACDGVLATLSAASWRRSCPAVRVAYTTARWCWKSKKVIYMNLSKLWTASSIPTRFILKNRRFRLRRAVEFDRPEGAIEFNCLLESKHLELFTIFMSKVAKLSVMSMDQVMNIIAKQLAFNEKWSWNILEIHSITSKYCLLLLLPWLASIALSEPDAISLYSKHQDMKKSSYNLMNNGRIRITASQHSFFSNMTTIRTAVRFRHY